MRSRYRVHEPQATYFVTSSVVAWLPIFTTAQRCNILIEAFEYCRTHKALQIYGWVILDNHFHAILSGPDLPQIIADFKRHSARRLLDQFEKERSDWLLNQLEYFRARHKTEKPASGLAGRLSPPGIDSDKMMEQKLDYIHNNPVLRGLVAAPEHWRYSSAHEWLTSASPVLRCDPWR